MPPTIAACFGDPCGIDTSMLLETAAVLFHDLLPLFLVFAAGGFALSMINWAYIKIWVIPEQRRALAARARLEDQLCRQLTEIPLRLGPDGELIFPGECNP